MKLVSNKKIMWFVLVISALIMLSACGNQEKETNIVNMIQPLELTQREEDILKLCNFTDQIGLFEFEIDDTIQEITLLLEGYEGGEKVEDWSDQYSLSERQGMVGIVMNRREGETEWLLGRHTKSRSGKTVFTTQTDLEKNNDYDGFVSGYLTDRIEIIPEQEIVLAVYVFDKDGNIAAYVPEKYLEDPKVLQENDLTYLLKCRFSAKGISSEAEANWQ